ncbi:glutathione peroxidase [Roseomonas sp. KE2513]|uniref:glutathione peroxidase n=1 Tax=Roseomonas sp. KE2513 TaxID=2479202 RepID=UPI0018DFF962|nr:glutathione peroxidase [Roseomonas sp. KE2513]MBI0534921.1 glutathione peroxidase [Roseomonas sp. KE2513]
MSESLLDLSARRPDGSALPLAEFRGKVLLVVNTASRCGFTPQYAGLEALQRRYADRGFTVLAFPCNGFAGQEPGDDAAIANFCSTTYDVTFPILAKIEVNGTGADPIFRHLKHAAPGALGTEAIKWNFTKFLIGRDGRVAGRYAPATAPEKLSADIERLLAEPG